MLHTKHYLINKNRKCWAAILFSFEYCYKWSYLLQMRRNILLLTIILLNQLEREKNTLPNWPSRRHFIIAYYFRTDWSPNRMMFPSWNKHFCLAPNNFFRIRRKKQLYDNLIDRCDLLIQFQKCKSATFAEQ